MRPKTPIAIRFWAKVDKTGACWLWTGARLATGHGQILIKAGATPAYAHHVAYVLTAKKAIPKGMYLVQTCGDKLCCNPEHLKVTSVKPARKKRIETVPRKPYQRRELTVDDIATIRRCFRTKEFTAKELAKRYGVSVKRIERLTEVIQGKVGTQWTESTQGTTGIS